MTEFKRKSTQSTDEFLSISKDHENQQVNGFVSKLVADIRKLYVYQPNQIKWMNERPKHRKAYEPTEVKYIDFLYHKNSGSQTCWTYENEESY